MAPEMERRKPPETPRGSLVDQQIRKAQEEGQFDDLPGAGKPLPDLAEVYDPAWWVKKLVRRERLSLLPPALAIKLQVERTLEKLPTVRQEEEVRARIEALNAEISRVNTSTTSGPPTTARRLDVEEVVRRWRQGSL